MRLHPDLADIHRRKVAALQNLPENDATCTEAVEIIRPWSIRHDLPAYGGGRTRGSSLSATSPGWSAWPRAPMKTAPSLGLFTMSSLVRLRWLRGLATTLTCSLTHRVCGSGKQLELKEFRGRSWRFPPKSALILGDGRQDGGIYLHAELLFVSHPLMHGFRGYTRRKGFDREAMPQSPRRGLRSFDSRFLHDPAYPTPCGCPVNRPQPGGSPSSQPFAACPQRCGAAAAYQTEGL